MEEWIEVLRVELFDMVDEIIPSFESFLVSEILLRLVGCSLQLSILNTLCYIWYDDFFILDGF